MKIFNLPDLGEGLPDAEIHQWFIKEGDTVELDQPIAAMETAKAVVEVPSPRAGTIQKLYGKVGDIIKTGHPLLEFTVDDGIADTSHSHHTVKEDSGTVVGNIKVANEVINENPMGIIPKSSTTDSIQAIPAVRALAKSLNVDLTTITGTGPNGRITANDVKLAKSQPKLAEANQARTTSIPGAEPLRGVRRAMALAMTQSHQTIVPVTIIDDADIHAWTPKTDITLRIIRAVIVAVKAQPELNAWFDNAQLARKLHSQIDLGIAMDSPEGLFVPVLKNVGQMDLSTQRATINRFKQQVSDRSIPANELQGATIMLSNFGSIAGRYANPVIAPPCVAIIGCGKIREEVVAHQGESAIHKILPLSITVDHRAITGGEATRFLKAMMDDLQLSA
ncbi:MAG: 2-oxo acid dehydrogenase subunit E2 [Legionellales bacterium]|nr:2-oxo acid dehydrogenase subunit E2 [Legionellales bacterium]